MQVDPGAQVASMQSSRFSSQPEPPQPLTHTQWKPPAEFWQVPPFLQRAGAWASHSSTSSEQSQPVEGGEGSGGCSWEPWEEARAKVAVSLAYTAHLSRCLGRGRCRLPARPGRCPRADSGAWHSRLDSPHSPGQ